jgi:hypothetical protein
VCVQDAGQVLSGEQRGSSRAHANACTGLVQGWSQQQQRHRQGRSWVAARSLPRTRDTRRVPCVRGRRRGCSAQLCPGLRAFVCGMALGGRRDFRQASFGAAARACRRVIQETVARAREAGLRAPAVSRLIGARDRQPGQLPFDEAAEGSHSTPHTPRLSLHTPRHPSTRHPHRASSTTPLRQITAPHVAQQPAEILPWGLRAVAC